MGCGHEGGVGGIAILSEEKVSVEAPVGFHVTDGRLDGGSSLELATDGEDEPALLSGKEDGGRPLIIVPAIVLVDIDALWIDTTDLPSIRRSLPPRRARPSMFSTRSSRRMPASTSFAIMSMAAVSAISSSPSAMRSVLPSCRELPISTADASMASLLANSMAFSRMSWAIASMPT